MVKSARRVIALGLTVSSCMLQGCNSARKELANYKEIIADSEKFSRKYLTSDAAGAREALNADASLLELATGLEPVGRAQLISLVYCRLCALEGRQGNKAGAAVNLLKAQYWAIRRAELSGVSATDALEAVRAMTFEKVDADVGDFDRKHNDGKAPRYVEQIPRIGDSK